MSVSFVHLVNNAAQLAVKQKSSVEILVSIETGMNLSRKGSTHQLNNSRIFLRDVALNCSPFYSSILLNRKIASTTKTIVKDDITTNDKRKLVSEEPTMR